MEKVKHTPGPRIKCTYGCYEVWTSPIQGNRLATFTSRVKAEGFLEAVKNNSVLIAAPELLNVAKKVRADLLEYENGRLGQSDLLRNISLLRMAITQATGEGK